MELQATALKGIVRSSDEGLFYLFPIQDVSTLQQTKAHLTCAIDVLSHPEECSPEQRLDAVRTLNSLVAALSVHDDDHYSAFDSALDGGNVQKLAGRASVKAYLAAKPGKEKWRMGYGVMIWFITLDHAACFYGFA